MKRLKRILLLVMVLVMSAAATSTVFARGFGGGRMMHTQNNRQIVCQIGENGICPAHEEGVCPVWGHVPGQGRNNDRGFRGGRMMHGHGHWSHATIQCCPENVENCWRVCISWDADGNIVFAEGCWRVDDEGNVIFPWEGRGQDRGFRGCRRLQ